MTAPNSAAARFRADPVAWQRRQARIDALTARVQADLDRLGIAGGNTDTASGRRRLCDDCGDEFAASNRGRLCRRCRNGAPRRCAACAREFVDTSGARSCSTCRRKEE